VRRQRPDRFVDVRFDAMLDDPLAQARTVLNALGLVPTTADDRTFQDYLERNRAERHGTHSYVPEDFGLSTEQLDRDFSFYTKEYL
jgi:hypothetical protein